MDNIEMFNSVCENLRSTLRRCIADRSAEHLRDIIRLLESI